MNAGPAPFEINGEAVASGERRTVDLPISVLSNHTPITLPVHVVHGRRAGPTLFVSAAIHGNEIIGVEIIRRLLRTRSVHRLRGTLMAIPVVNAFGFISHSRYLPDQRDLNRSFPGRERGSLAAQLANLFLQEIVRRSDLGIDLHSAATHRTNLPQVRIAPTGGALEELARAFAAPVILTSKLREGSLRLAAQEIGVDVLLFEGGEGLRFDEFAVRIGLAGILRVMHRLEMIGERGVPKAGAASVRAETSAWLRAPEGGLLRAYRTIGDTVEIGDTIGVIADPFGEEETSVSAAYPGLVIGRTNLPVVNQGDALFHVARVRSTDSAAARLDALSTQVGEDPLFDEDEII